MSLPKIYKDFFAQKVFTFEELWQRYKKENTINSVRTLVRDAIRRSYIRSIKKGLYCILPQGATQENYIVDKYLVAAKLTSDSLIAYHSALELLGVAQSIFNTVFVLSQKRLATFEFQEVSFTTVTGPFGFGETDVVRDGVTLHVTNRERTLIDCVDRLKYAGGLEECLKSIEVFPSVSFQNIESYLKKYHKLSLYSKIGFILSLFEKQWTFPDKIKKNLKAKLTKKVYYLTDVKDCQLNKEWNLMIPKNIGEIIRSA